MNVAWQPKPSDKCRAKHIHADEECKREHYRHGKRTSQISRRLLRVLKFEALSDGFAGLKAMSVVKSKGQCNRVVVDLGPWATVLPGSRVPKDVPEFVARN